MIMKNRKQTAAKVTSQVRELGPRASFLDVLRDACAHNGRYTLTAESGGQMFTVLVDRGGPFNAIGGGTAGSAALVAAAQLRSGRCTVSLGWPVDQPLYQPGLDLTLRALVEGVVEPSTLPRHRGVDSLRNQEWRDVAPAMPAEYAPATAPMAMEATPSPVPDSTFAAPPAPVPAAPVAVVPEPAAQAPMTAAPVREMIQPAAAPVPAAATFPTRPWVRPEAATTVSPGATAWSGHGTDAVLPAGAEGPAAIHTAKHFATQALLWLCEVEDEKDYSLQEAASLARHSLVEGLSIGLSSAVHPLRKEMSTHIDRIKKDWEKSAETAARATRKKRVRATSADADEEFRLF